MKAIKLTDKALIRQYIEGKESAFEILFKRYEDRIFNYIYMIVKDYDLTNDIFQDTFIKVIRTLKKGKYNEEGKFLPWALRIAHNLSIDHFRKEKKMPTIGESNSTSSSDDEVFNIFDVLELQDTNIEDELIEQQIISDLSRVVKLLPDEQREIVELRHFKGMSFKDIADRKNISINTALGRMRYALINLRKLIEEKNLVLTAS